MEYKDLSDKIVSFTPVDRTFVNDEGQTVDYTVFELVYTINGENRAYDLKSKSMSDKIVLLEAAESVA